MYFKNFSNKGKITSSYKNKGLIIIKNFISLKYINEIKKKSFKMLNKPSLLNKASNVKVLSEKSNKNIKLYWLPKKYRKKIQKGQYRQPTGEMELKIKNNDIRKGYKYYGKLTNSIDIKDPLINLKEIQKIVFDKRLINTAQIILKDDVYLGYVAFRFHFSNNLPAIDFNYFHTDDRLKITKSKNKVLKLLVPFHLSGKQKIEFNHIVYNKKKMNSENFYKLQYTKFKNLPNYLKKKKIRPNVLNRDIFFFDPNNFYHNADKPNKLRLMLYIVIVKKNNYMIPKTKKINIKRKYFEKLDTFQKNFAKFLNKI